MRVQVECTRTALAAFGKNARRAINEASDLHDANTADLFTEVSRGIDELVWMVEAHFQKWEMRVFQEPIQSRRDRDGLS